MKRRPPTRAEFIFGEICNWISVGFALLLLVGALMALAGCTTPIRSQPSCVPVWRDGHYKGCVDRFRTKEIFQ